MGRHSEYWQWSSPTLRRKNGEFCLTVGPRLLAYSPNRIKITSHPSGQLGLYASLTLYGHIKITEQRLVYWPLMGGLLHLVQRGGAWAGWGPAQSPPRCTKCNSPPINGQCTNFVLVDVPLKLPLFTLNG